MMPDNVKAMQRRPVPLCLRNPVSCLMMPYPVVMVVSFNR
jgi:hypothetical protein